MALATKTNVWVDPSEVAELARSGPAFENLKKAALSPPKVPKIADQEDQADVSLMGAGLYWMATKDAAAKAKVEEGCKAAIGTEKGGRTLALGRNLIGYVIAADCVGYRDSTFVSWVDKVRTDKFSGGPETLIATHEERPNNWGTWAGASRVAAAMYLRDVKELNRAAAVFEGWLGSRAKYSAFKYSESDLGGKPSWQADPSKPVGVNPKGAKIQGHSVDGVLPDDQRRGGGFTWPPPVENYVREALQGVVATGHMLKRAGFTPWAWGDLAIARACRWFVDEAKGAFEGDDEQIPWIVNFYVPPRPGAPKFLVSKAPAQAAKGYSFCDWTHARS